MASEDAGGQAARPPVRLGERFEIFPDRPLAELRSPNAAGFVASDHDRPNANIFGLVCDADLPPRHELIGALQGLRTDALLVPRHWGVVVWPPTGRRHFAVIFDRPTGSRVTPAITQPIEPLTEDEIIHHALPGLVDLLKDLFAAGLTHRAIRPTNLFFRDAQHRAVVLGECVSAPPAALQPLACEPIESALANASGRGNGTAADDLYALGATLLYLLYGKYPGAGANDEQLVAEKIARGSYAALLGSERPTGRLVELLRGLLADDPRERWTIDDVETWLEGRRQAPRQTVIVRRAARPYEVSGQPFYTARGVGYAFARDPAAALRAAKGPEFEVWLQRSLCDDERSRLVAAALAEGHDVGLSGHDERMVARLCIALDPSAPVRYKGFAAAIDGFGSALVAAFRGRGSVQHVAEAIGGRLPQFWFAAQPALKPEQVPILKAFERIRPHLDDRRPGFGIERILYEMNPRLHCLSPAIESDYVLDVGQVMAALERSSQQRSGDDFQIDRHLAAFIAARHRAAGSDWYDAVAGNDGPQRTLGTLYVLARLQAINGPAAAPALAQRAARPLGAVIERYHNRARRARIAAELPKAVAKGNFAELLSLVDNAHDRAQDAQGFQLAQREYIGIEREFERLRIEGPKRPERAAQLGQRYAATTASFLAWLVALAVVVAMS
ncbi:MAG TPA: hypothetical protein VLX85_04395 [Stellaceae bacterium]|nr:hypothetical protein [Stellaceae bacterium]